MDSIAILTVGDELVEGRLVDTNAGWLSDRLTARGLAVVEHRSVGDDRKELVAALRELASRRSAVLVSGGLGPTSDDLTAACAAEAFAVPLVRSAAAVDHVERFFRGRGREMPSTNLKQADLPAGCGVLPNPRGTALGFQVDTDHSQVFFMPGVPHELRGMFLDSVQPQLLARHVAEPPLFATVKVFGLGESDVAQRLEGDDPVVPERGDLLFQYRATFPEIHLRMVLRGGDAPSLAGGLGSVRERLGQHVYASGLGDVPTTHAEAAVNVLRAQNSTLAVNDRLTGGLMTAALFDVEGVDRVLRGARLGLGQAADLEAETVTVMKSFGADIGVGLGAGREQGCLVAIAVGGGGGPVRREVRFPLPADRLRRLGVSVALELVRRLRGAEASLEKPVRIR